jgi:hypothetical protein
MVIRLKVEGNKLLFLNEDGLQVLDNKSKSIIEVSVPNQGDDKYKFVIVNTKTAILNPNGFLFSEIKDENGNSFTDEDALNSFLFANTGFNPASGGSGAVDSVNGKTGVVVLDGTDIELLNGGGVTVTEAIVDLSDETVSNKVLITELADFPTPIGDTITISTDDITYQLVGGVDIGANKIVVTGLNNKFIALNPSTDGLISVTTGALIECNKGLAIDNVFLFAPASSSVIKATGTGVEIFTAERTTFIGGTKQIEIIDFDVTLIASSLSSGCVDGIVLDGDNINFLIDKTLFRDVTGNCIDLQNAQYKAVGINLCTCTNTATTNFLKVAPNSGNIKTGGEGTVTNCKVDLTLGGTASIGTNPLDLLWDYSGNNNIKTSDRILPTGWEVSFDGLITTPTLAVTSTDTKLTIDGGGANSNSTRLPNAIQGISKLWDVVANKIIPIAIGDSFDMRVQVAFQGLSGNPTELTLILDIGSGATPTIPIAEDTKQIKGLSSPVIFSFPIFALDTFFANGGQIFLKTDTGTATVEERSIFLIRTSSGA